MAAPPPEPFRASGKSLSQPFPFLRPEHCVLTDAQREAGDPYRSRVVDINPDSFNMQHGAEWPRLQVPGYSSEVLQWSHTKSIEHTFQVRWDFLVARRRAAQRGLPDVDTALDLWLQAFTHPIEPGRAPALLEVYWPSFLWIAGAVVDVRTKYTRWSREGVKMAYECDITMNEVRSTFLSGDTYIASMQVDPASKVAAPEDLESELDALLGPIVGG